MSIEAYPSLVVCWVGHGVGCVLGGSSSGVCVGWVMEWVGRVRGVRVVC